MGESLTQVCAPDHASHVFSMALAPMSVLRPISLVSGPLRLQRARAHVGIREPHGKYRAELPPLQRQGLTSQLWAGHRRRFAIQLRRRPSDDALGAGAFPPKVPAAVRLSSGQAVGTEVSQR